MSTDTAASVPSSVTFLASISGVILFTVGITILMMLRIFGPQPAIRLRWIATFAAVVNIGMVGGLLATFNGLAQFSVVVLFVIIALTASVPVILVWRLSTIPMDHTVWTDQR